MIIVHSMFYTILTYRELSDSEKWICLQNLTAAAGAKVGG